MTNSALSRRRVLAALGVGSAAALAGCTGDGGPGIGGDPEYEAGEIGDVDGEPRTEDELVAAEALAEQEIDEGVTPLEEISLTDHEFVFEDDYRGSTVQGTVENTGGDRIELVEVRVRVYNDDGEQIGRYLASTGDLDADVIWEFQVIILEPPDDLAEYDITALGTPT
ncbi:FxLYD domain-containing protein [Natronorubrum sp. DTA28]|uniref:FxLYD domain-containing protein n=1 Tax=Natronorubrum sp. DTA28 TaxID=3447019 RepID=UPI003F86C7D2